MAGNNSPIGIQYEMVQSSGLLGKMPLVLESARSAHSNEKVKLQQLKLSKEKRTLIHEICHCTFFKQPPKMLGGGHF